MNVFFSSKTFHIFFFLKLYVVETISQIGDLLDCADGGVHMCLVNELSHTIHLLNELFFHELLYVHHHQRSLMSLMSLLNELFFIKRTIHLINVFIKYFCSFVNYFFMHHFFHDCLW